MQLTRQHSLPGGAAVTRSYAHAWDYMRCRPTQQTIEPASATLRVTSDLAYDAYGNVSSVRVTPVGGRAEYTLPPEVRGGARVQNFSVSR